MFATATTHIENVSAKIVSAKTNPPQPILNGKYLLLNRLGEGNTSKVYLGQTLESN